MTSKTNNTLYWVFTVVFAILMVFSSVGGLQPSEQAVKMLHEEMGYPIYFIQFISVAKLIGSIAILIPGLNKTIKEWAYAGLFFDLAGAIFSNFSSAATFDPMMLTMLLWVLFGILSYYFWKKKVAV